MRRPIYLYLAAGIVISSSACQTVGGQPTYPFYTAAQIGDRLTAFDRKSIHDCMESNQDFCRNEIVTAQLDVVDYVYNQFKRMVFTTSGAVDITGDLLAGALSGAGAITGGERAKTVLSGIATVITGGKSSIDKNLFLQQSAHVLLGRMDALRVNALKPIREGLQQPAAKYPLWQATRDINTYIAAGSIGAAITDIEQNSGKAKNEAETATQKIITDKYGPDDNSALLRLYWKPNSKVDTDHQAKLIEEMKKPEVNGGNDIVEFIEGGQHAAGRATAVKDLKLK